MADYRLPKVIKHQGEKTQQLSQDRRDKWLANIARVDLKASSYDNLRICSDHFINKPADLYDQLNPDWAPTVKMGRCHVLKTPTPTKSRYNRSLIRSSKKLDTAAASALLELSCGNSETDPDLEMESGTASQTDVTCSLLKAMDSEVQRLQMENARLQQKVDSQNFDLPFFYGDDAKVKYYTGLTNFSVLKALYDYVEPDIPITHKSALNKFQQLMVVLMKLRLNASNQDLAVRFGVSDTTISRVFQTGFLKILQWGY
ncbi:uncharacterized protein LOC132735245 [Ruditapes philippinarum]|uniref:uncharacterized protein LOC132735245 n=1 Tax=Ruditapes philippinarum TaxID=129788 RepID=UPI00295AF763|nr:uncharacterized protein LOC132735245 [Ruditapes philippinarum]